MKNNCLIFFIFITNLLAAQAYESIHQLQSKYYSSISTPPVDKVHIKTGIDILLDKKQNLITDKRIALARLLDEKEPPDRTPSKLIKSINQISIFCDQESTKELEI